MRNIKLGLVSGFTLALAGVGSAQDSSGFESTTIVDQPDLQAAAKSQPVIQVPDRILTMPMFERLELPRATWRYAHARVSSAREEMRSAQSDHQALEPVAALSGFFLRFENGDHKIRRIAILDEDRFTRFAFADQDNNDPFEGRVRWMVFSQGQQHEVTAHGGGTFHIPLEEGPENHSLVLTGFNFERQPGTDANVRTLGVWLEEDETGAPVARVTLIDDMGLDFRGLAEATFAGMAISLIPTAEIVASHAVGVDALARFGAQGGPRRYAATVQYAWIPNELVIREAAAAGGNDREFDSVDAVVLQGFFLHFDNEDHHLFEIGVDPELDRGILFRDGNWDDPVRWEVQYLHIRDDRRG